MYSGYIVCSVSGHDKGCFMVVVGQTDKGILVSDGKHHPVDKPKLKNIKHLRFTDFKIPQGQYDTNRSIRKAIFSAFSCYKEEA